MSGEPRPRGVALFLAADFLYWASLYLYVPTLPGHVEARTGSLAAVGIVVSMYGLWQALARIPVGVAVDATGRSRTFLIGGFLLAAAGAFVMSAGRSTEALAVGRGLTGLAAATWVPMVTTFAAYYPAERMVYAASLLTMVGAVGRLFAMSLGGVLTQVVGPAAPFGFAVAAAVMAAAVVVVVPLEVRPPRRVSLAGFARVARRPDVLVPTLVQTVASFASWAVQLSFVPILACRLGAGDAAKGFLMSLGTAAALLGNSLVATLERRVRAGTMVRAAIVLMSAGIVLAALVPSLPALFVAAAIMGTATGLSYPTLMGLSVRGVAVEERATATGIHQAVYAVGMFTGPWLGGLAADRWGIPTMFLLTAALTLAAAWPPAGMLGRDRQPAGSG